MSFRSINLARQINPLSRTNGTTPLARSFQGVRSFSINGKSVSLRSSRTSLSSITGGTIHGIKRTLLDTNITGYRFPFGTPMWREQPGVPKLPIPSLRETAERYIEFVTPLVSSEQLEQTKKYVADFIKPGGEGEKLQVSTT
jgi:hypothetical protein